jgi:NhaP-type Na+/H+ and K+/H+ antiporter
VIGVASLLLVVTLGLLITPVATVALRTTGLSTEVARFQARSAFTGVGFTTVESEDILAHPAQGLMVLSSAGLAGTLASLLQSFTGTTGYRQPAGRIVVLVVGLFALWRLASSSWVDTRLSRAIELVLRRWTALEARDYVRLLQIGGSYSIDEIDVDDDDWVEGRPLRDLRLNREGVVVLGVRRADGRDVGVPSGATTIQAGDTVIVYGEVGQLDEFRDRKEGVSGDEAHERASARHRRLRHHEENQLAQGGHTE